MTNADIVNNHRRKRARQLFSFWFYFLASPPLWPPSVGRDGTENYGSSVEVHQVALGSFSKNQIFR